uniref:Uncharacterized protein n=1 Tax=Amphimedon queenslandica TaxID=400682 RepID=A0A1X7VLE5_AMPQE
PGSGSCSREHSSALLALWGRAARWKSTVPERERGRNKKHENKSEKDRSRKKDGKRVRGELRCTDKIIRREKVVIPNLQSQTRWQMHLSLIKTVKMFL